MPNKKDSDVPDCHDSDFLPKHIGIIMDGNGRWASLKGKPRTFGHKEGLEVAKRIVRCANQAGIRYLSLYTFSTENWKRAKEEVNFLMGLIHTHLNRELDFYRENRIKIRHSGDLKALPKRIQDDIVQAMNDTDHFDSMTVNLAINYGGRDEILRAISKLEGSERTSLVSHDLEKHLDLPDFPAVDMVIRTGGEKRLSNFLLWESAYAELYFSDKLWPDWNETDFLAALDDFRTRHRRFGGTQ